MRRKTISQRITYGVLAALILFAAPVSGQPKSRGSLTLEAALNEALQNNPELQVVRRDLGVARGELMQAQIYPFNPALELEGNGGRSRSKESPVERRTVGGFAVGLSQTVEIRGQRGLRTNIATAKLQETEWEVRDAERRVLADVMGAFGELLQAQERLKLAQQTVALAEETRETARKQFEAGEVPRLDLLRADVELRRALTRRVAEERRAAATRKHLNLRLGRAPDAPLRADGPLLLPELPGTRAALLQQALELRPDLNAATAGLQTVRHSVSLVRAERLFPEVELALRYEEDHALDERERRGILEVAIPLPLFNRRQGELEAALAEGLKQEAQVALIRSQIKTEVATAFGQFQSSQQIVEEYVQHILPQQEQNFRLLREGYTLGQFGLSDVLLAQRELTDVRFDYLEAIGEFNTAVAELRRATGLTMLKPAGRKPGSGLKPVGYFTQTSRQKGYRR
ncbi:MAG: TolC family protein [Candidatus Methylomirabilales bacterium]